MTNLIIIDKDNIFMGVTFTIIYFFVLILVLNFIFFIKVTIFFVKVIDLLSKC